MIVSEEMKNDERINKIINAVTSYNGDSRLLSRAIGFYYMGLFFGWRYLYLVHGKKTVRNYEKILKIKITEEFDAISTESARSPALCEVADQHTNYWKVISHDIPIHSNRSHIQAERCMALPSTRQGQN